MYQRSNAIIFQYQTPDSYLRDHHSLKRIHQPISLAHHNLTQNLKKMATQDPTTTSTATKQEEEKPWHAAFPAPRLEAGVMPAARAQMILSMKIASMLIIDVRRTDYEGGSVRGSLNIPAQGFWWNRGML
jgi:rhodanese-related sulfurtransferase